MPAKRRPRRPADDSLAANLRFFAILMIAAILLRSLVAAPFSIPSESMLPRLLVGDYLFVAKWPYGWSRHSFPFSLAPIDGRIGGAVPARGDVIVFKTPGDNRTDYIKRLIGLPGDQVQIRGGRLILNGEPVPKLRVADFLDPVSPNSPCRPVPGLRIRLARAADGGAVCRYPRYRETLPGGRSYDVLDIGTTPADDTPVFVVPEDHYFLMGDNRDRSADSRFPAEPGGGIGYVPAENLVGRAMVTFFSTDGSAGWLMPWTWPGATRWNRIGEGF
ncbi:signal peptidase I [Sphingomonas solaris]|uniref:Signal peptidase I n=1 Tax=Alterirhizorhabdus solaris TaxID=2529389 RepID=A0A558QVZ3_9SPHN|nr:signal peptidase I [Sphingomonas solaris]